jgi:hypothetical protein
MLALDSGQHVLRYGTLIAWPATLDSNTSCGITPIYLHSVCMFSCALLYPYNTARITTNVKREFQQYSQTFLIAILRSCPWSCILQYEYHSTMAKEVLHMAIIVTNQRLSMGATSKNTDNFVPPRTETYR